MTVTRHRVVLITEIISPYRIPIFNALAEREEIDLHVIFLAENDPTQRQWLVYKDEIRFSYEVLSSVRKRIRGNNFLLNWGVSAALRRAAPDAILCGGYNYLATWRALTWANAHQVPLLLWVESNANDRRSGHRVVERLKRTFLRRCKAFLAAGTSSRQYLMAYGIPASSIFNAPNAVGNEFFSTRSERARQDAPACRQTLNLPARYFLCVGRLVPEKGIFDLLEAYGLLPAELKSQVALVFVGSGPAGATLAAKVDSITSGTVRIAGFAQKDELAVYYGLADAFMFPTHSDPWGLVVNEAMACGLPIVATEIGGCVPDLVKPNQNGFVVPAGDIESLKQAMSKLGEDAQLRRSMGEASREIIAHFSPSGWAQGVVQAVSACVENSYAK